MTFGALPLLMVVTMEVDREDERAFEAWYQAHVPRLLSLDGFEWARRYRSETSPGRYLALYAISDLPAAFRLRTREASERPEVLASELARFQSDVVVRSARTVVYGQIDGPSFTTALFADDGSILLSPIPLKRDRSELEFRRIEEARLDQDTDGPSNLYVATAAGVQPDPSGSAEMFHPTVKYWP